MRPFLVIVVNAVLHAAIPSRLFITSRDGTLDHLPAVLRKNVERTLHLNSDLELTFYDDAKCLALLQKDFPAAARLFPGMWGPNKADICRAAFLYLNGGFYIDLDVQPMVTLRSMVGPETTLMTVFNPQPSGYSTGVNWALLASSPGSEVLHATLEEMVASPPGKHWRKKEWGPRLFEQGFSKVCDDFGVRVNSAADVSMCGMQARFYYEEDMMELANRLQGTETAERSAEHNAVLVRALQRKHNTWEGLHFAMFAEDLSGKQTRLVAYSRYDDCLGWNCGANTSAPNVAPTMAPSPQVMSKMAVPAEVAPIKKVASRVKVAPRVEVSPDSEPRMVVHERRKRAIPLNKHRAQTAVEQPQVKRSSSVPASARVAPMVLAAFLLALSSRFGSAKVFWGCSYCACSASMIVCNKLAVGDTPTLLAATQMVAAVVVLAACWPLLGVTSTNWQQLYRWLPVCVLFVAMLQTSLVGFQFASVSTVVVMRALQPLYSLMLETVVTKPPSHGEASGCALLLIGAVFYFWSDHGQSTRLGVEVLVLNGVLATLDRVYQKWQLSNDLEVGTGALLLTSNLGGLLLLAAFLPWRAELPVFAARAVAWSHGQRIGDMMAVICSCIGGLGIGFSGLAFQRVVSASTFLAVATGLRALLVLVDHAVFDTHLGACSVLGLSVVLLGSMVCWTDRTEQKKG
jgi:hypothetical protein